MPKAVKGKATGGGGRGGGTGRGRGKGKASGAKNAVSTHMRDAEEITNEWGEQKGKEKAVGAEGEEGAPMDVDQEEDLPEAIGKNDDTGEAIDADQFMGVSIGYLEKKEKLARVGFMRMNVMEPLPGMEWGHFNDRTYRADWIKSLVGQYSYQLKNCTDSTAMTGTVRRSWVKNLDEAVDSVHNRGHIDRIPLLELTAEGAKAAKKEGLWMFSGNHRRHALEIFLDGEREKLAALEAKIAKLHQKQRDVGVSNTVDGKEKEVVDEARRLRAMIEKNSHWAVWIYNRGER